MSASGAPRDSITHTQLFVPIDATGRDFYDLGRRFATPVAVLTEVNRDTQHRYARQTGAWDPRCLRWHDLKRTVAGLGIADRRLSVQVVNDYEAEYADARSGDAPFGQPEVFTSANRTTREVDTSGRVALPSSHRRIIDSEDDRYALSLTCRSVALRAASNEVPDAKVEVQRVQQNVRFHARGSAGGTTFLSEAVSVGGVTFFGGAAVNAARRAVQAGRDAGAAASAAVTGRSIPREPKPVPVVPDLDPPPSPSAHSVPLLDHPAGYVWSKSGRVGLLGTLVVPEGASGHYFTGREGTRIGPLPWRHDAQVSMGPETVGRIVFVANDAAQVKRGTGRKIKGEMWADSSRANKDTELGLETVQFRPVIAVDADLPPRYPPPPPPWDPPPEEEEEEEQDDEDDDEESGGGNPAGKRRRRLRPPAGSPETPRELILVGGGPFFELPPVKHPEGQARDLSGPGVPCPNKTAGVLLGPEARGNPGVVRVPGGYVQFHGYSALTPVPGGLAVGGVERPIRRPAAPAGRVSDSPVVPLGFPQPGAARKRKDRRGVVVLPPLGGDRGVPRGHGERYDRAKRRWRREQAEEEKLRELEELEQRLRRAGRDRYADRVQRARERVETKRREREERAQRLRDYKARKRREAAERKEKQRERWASRRRERVERRKQRREQPRRRPTAPQGGYVIDLRDPDLDSLTPEQRRLLERDVARGWLDPSVLGMAGPRSAEPRRMGEWNVANAPLPFLGSVGSLEQWANVATYQLRALQQIVLGAFGGPDYLASNLALVDQSGTGHLLAGCGKAPVLTVRACGGVALCVEGDLVVKGRLVEEGAAEAPTVSASSNSPLPPTLPEEDPA